MRTRFQNRKLSKNFSDERGSALLIVLLIVASAIVSALVAIQSNVSISQIYARKSASQSADNVTQMMSTMLADPIICKQGFDGTGVQFLDASGNPANFSQSLASSATGQNVSLPSNYPVTGGSTLARFQANFQFPDAPLRVRRVYATSPVDKGGGVYTMLLKADFDAVDGATTRGLSARTLMGMQIQTAAGVMTSCGIAATVNSNQALCEGMNCTYTTTAIGGGSCFCPLTPVTCLNGNYISSINSTTRTPICSTSTITRSCALTANGYLVAFDAQSQPVCAQVDLCPAGTSATGLGGAAAPTTCKCAAATDVWNSTTSTCGAATATVTCTFAGTSTGGLGGAASPSGCFCDTSGQTWSSATSTCGTTTTTTCTFAGTSTGGAGGAASPSGCFCNTAGETWNGTSCTTGSTSTCPPMTLTWNVGGNSCSAAFPATPASTTSGIVADTNLNPAAGAANFMCDATGNWAPSPLSNATCYSSGVVFSGSGICNTSAFHLAWESATPDCTSSSPVEGSACSPLGDICKRLPGGNIAGTWHPYIYCGVGPSWNGSWSGGPVTFLPASSNITNSGGFAIGGTMCGSSSPPCPSSQPTCGPVQICQYGRCSPYIGDWCQ